LEVARLDTSLLFSPEFWEKAWDEANIKDKERREKKAVDVWNRRAGNYDRNVGSNSGKKRVDESLAFLESYGILNRKLKILDLGCGPGNFSLAFAERGHSVWALDPAEKMLDQLRAKLETKPELKSRVIPVVADWIPLELGDYGWEKQFDLIFASMTPGVYNVPTLKKAMNACKGYVYLSRFAGPRSQPSAEAVWQRLNGNDYYSQSLDILFPQNWLYATGYRPAAHYVRWEREHSQLIAEAVDEIRDVLALRLDIDAAVEKMIEDYVIEQAEDGIFTEKKGAASAMLLWRVDKEVMNQGG
jgi:SAM-dependent methyltransferase